MSGSGRAVVCSVGKNCLIASRLDKETLEDEEETMTPLQERLENMAGQIGKYAYFAGIIIFLTQIIFLSTQIAFTEKELLSGETLMRLLDFFTTALTIVIVAVPEGLPLAVSISLAYSIGTMKEDHLLVKNMEACETMGTVSNICTGKTATLTKNEMAVT